MPESGITQQGDAVLDFRFDEKDENFRGEVREFIKRSLPTDMATRVRQSSYLGHHADAVRWCQILHRKGWSVPHWPEPYGGTGWSPLRLHIFHEECAQADAPHLPSAGVYLVGPVIYSVGTAAQKARFLPPIVRGEVAWCQGFSEPNAGSDLASLRTSAVLQGNRYIVNGQKLWTGGAHVAEWGFFLVRTDTGVRPQLGISFMLINMRATGVTVRPIVTLDGEHHTNEVFLDNVEVPVDQLVGEPNRGWTYAKTLLGNERTMSAEVYWSTRELGKLKAIARREMADGQPLLQQAGFCAKVAKLEIDLRALSYSVLRVLAAERNKYPAPAVTSALKLRGSELMQRVTELQAEAIGLKSLRLLSGEGQKAPGEPYWPDYTLGRTGGELTLRASTIFGGTREIQKNIIAKTAFDL